MRCSYCQCSLHTCGAVTGYLALILVPFGGCCANAFVSGQWTEKCSSVCRKSGWSELWCVGWELPQLCTLCGPHLRR
ncbi:hypothetical protein JZ751_015490 [Albula glossodonta]|uniref:Uncharacterized protein n=1 Tax=Albula glossodonta TaxID=121402 RepID=A0A8T2MV15_9TELE|nr:hypothetical protein JZ751_015490 [Albula glossodonta]